MVQFVDALPSDSVLLLLLHVSDVLLEGNKEQPLHNRHWHIFWSYVYFRPFIYTHFLIVLRYFDLNLSVWSPALVSNPRCCLPNLLAFTSVCMSVCMCMCVRQWLGSCILYWKSWGFYSVSTQENNISNHDLSHLFIFYQSFLLLLLLYMIIIITIGQIFISL